MNMFDFDSPYTRMLFGKSPYPYEIKKSVKRCGLTRKQWKKKKRERKNRKEARKRK